MSEGTILVGAPIITSFITAPITYILSRCNGTPLYKAGLWYSAATIVGAGLINVATWKYIRKESNKDRTNGAGLGLLMMFSVGYTTMFSALHLGSYWITILSIKNRRSIASDINNAPRNAAKTFKKIFK
jgi:hypothetical protein